MDKVVVTWDYKSQKLEDRKSKITRCFKTCLRCRERKPIYQFSKDKRNTNGRTSVCKKCRIIEYLKYYQENRDRILIVHKKYRDDHERFRAKYYQDYQEKNREKLSKLASEWYQANKEAIKKRNLKYYNANLEACKQRKELWRENNKEKIKKYN
ncbi:unnamed protein product, partial [marine sediment metagenome]